MERNHPNRLGWNCTSSSWVDRLIGVDVGALFVQDSDGTPIEMWGLDLSEGNEGDLLFDTTWTPSAGGNLSFLWSAASFEDGVFVISAKESRTHYAFQH